MIVHKSYSYKILDNPAELQGKMVVEVVITEHYTIIITSGTIFIFDIMLGTFIKQTDLEILEALKIRGINESQLI